MKTIFSIIFLTLSFNLISQNKIDDDNSNLFTIIDTSSYRCEYSYTYQPDSVNYDYKKEVRMILLIGKKFTCYINSYNYYIDSLRHRLDKGLISNETMSAGFTKYRTGGPKHFIITNKEKFSSNIRYTTINETFETEDNYSLNWKLGIKTDSIAGYLCRNAFTNFRGRDYTAWYSTDIPLQYGPYKFKGLPGLIIKISDSRQSHIFELRSMQKQKISMIQENKKTIKMSNKQLEKSIRNNRLKGIENVKAWFAKDPEKVLRITQNILNENNPIEL